MSIDKLNGVLTPNRFIPIDTEELTALEQMSRLTKKVNEVVDATNHATDGVKGKLAIVDYVKDMKENRKLDDVGDFTGSWFGISSPSYSEPGQAGVVESLRVENETARGSHTSLDERITHDVNYVKTYTETKKNDKFSFVVGDFNGLKNLIDSFNGEETTTIYLKPNTYLFESKIELPSNITLIGGYGVVFKWKGKVAHDNVFLLTKQESTVGGYLATKNITISGIKFDGENIQSNFGFIVTGHSQNVMIEQCEFLNINSSWHCIELNSTYNATIRDCVFIDNNSTVDGTEVIQLDIAINEVNFPWGGKYDNSPCKKINILNNTFINSRSSCVGSHSYYATQLHTEILISGNQVENCHTFIDFYDYENMVVSNNIVNNTANFLVVRFGDKSSDNITISNNYFNGFGRIERGSGRFINVMKMDVISCKDWIVTGNQIEHTGDTGIGITGTRFNISNNILINCLWAGIHLYGVTYSSVANNILKFAQNRENSQSYGDLTLGGNVNVKNKNNVINGNTIEMLCVRETDDSFFINNLVDNSRNTSDISRAHNNYIKNNFKSTGVL